MKKFNQIILRAFHVWCRDCFSDSSYYVGSSDAMCRLLDDFGYEVCFDSNSHTFILSHCGKVVATVVR